MCVVERKTYIQEDGRQYTVETNRPCHRAVGPRLCSNVERRNERIRVVETRPESANNESDNPSVTETRDGRRIVYRDGSKRSSNSSSLRRSATMSDHSRVSTPSSATSATYVDSRPSAPTPPPAAPAFPSKEENTPLQSPMSPPDPKRTIKPGGTAVYEYPPHLDPEPVNRERPRGSNSEQERSPSSTGAVIDDARPSTPPPRRRPTISIDTGSRRDSGRDVPPRESKREGKRPATDDRRRGKESERDEPSESEERRQARLERERTAATEQRQADRLEKQRVRDASRERHVRGARDALEGRRESPPGPDPSYIEAAIQAELSQMEREKEVTRQRESYDSARRYGEPGRWDGGVQSGYSYPYPPAPSSPTAVRPPSRRMTNDGFPGFNPPSPFSARAQPQQRVSLHQENRSSIREQGMNVIERKMAELNSSKAASDSLNEALRDVSLDDAPYTRGRGRDRDRDPERITDRTSTDYRRSPSPPRRRQSQRYSYRTTDDQDLDAPTGESDSRREPRRSGRTDQRTDQRRSARPTVDYEDEVDPAPPRESRDTRRGDDRTQYDEYGEEIQRRRPTARDEYYEDAYERTEDSRRGDEGKPRRKKREGRGKEVYK